MANSLTRMLPELDIDMAVEQENTGAVQEYGRQVELLAMELYQQKQMDKLEQLVDRQRRCIARCSDILQDTNPIPYEVGRMSGMLELMVQVIRNQHRQVQIATQVAELYQRPHFKEILAAISSNPGIQHARLAEKISVDTSTLTGIMKGMEQTGLVDFVRSGKYKYYSLTSDGAEYTGRRDTVLYQKPNERENISWSVVFEKRNGCVSFIHNEQIYEGASVESGEARNAGVDTRKLVDYALCPAMLEADWSDLRLSQYRTEFDWGLEQLAERGVIK